MFPGSEPGSAFMRILSFSADNHTHSAAKSKWLLQRFVGFSSESKTQNLGSLLRLSSIFITNMTWNLLLGIRHLNNNAKLHVCMWLGCCYSGGMPEGQGGSQKQLLQVFLKMKYEPVCCQTLPKGDGPVSSAGQDPAMCRSLGFGAHTHVRVQTKTQQEAAQQGGVVLTVPLWGTNSRIVEITSSTSWF